MKLPNADHLPMLQVPFPRPVTALHQIEVTSRCNLACPYCPQVKMGKRKHAGEGWREPQDMSSEHFHLALAHVRYYVQQGTQHELNLAGIGESTLHPEFPHFVRTARLLLPQLRFVLATNGLTASDELAELFKECKVAVWVSLHVPAKAGKAVRLYGDAGVLEGTSDHPSTDGNDWAGQVEFEGPRHKRAVPCTWLREGRVMAMADGNVTACCLDAKGTGAIGHVNDRVGSLRTKPYGLCRTCHHEVRVYGYDQRGGA